MIERQLRELLCLWRRRLGLEGWDIDLRIQDASIEPLDEHTLATVQRHVAYQRAIIFWSSHLLDGGPPPPAGHVNLEPTFHRLEITLVHELLHLWMAPFSDALEDDIDGMVHRDVMTVLHAGLMRSEEHLVDTLARALVRAFDAPAPWHRSSTPNHQEESRETAP